MEMINKNKEKYKGLWTRLQGKEESILDYIITDREHLHTIKDMLIDEEKQYGLYRSQQGEKTYSDHNAMLLTMNIITEEIKQQKKKIITKIGYEQYRRIIEQKQVSKIITNEKNIKETYKKWSGEIENSIKMVEKPVRKNQRRNIKQLKLIRKNLRKQC